MNSWTMRALDGWSQWLTVSLTPALAWPRAMEAAYRPLMLPQSRGAARAPRSPEQGPAPVIPLRPDGTTRLERPATAADGNQGLYAAMDEEELAEALAFHQADAAYKQALGDIESYDRQAPAQDQAAEAPIGATRAPARPRGLPAVGESAVVVKTFGWDDVAQFARLSGDRNPLHVEPGAWKGTPFTGNIVHGILTASLFSQLLGMELPGPGAVYLSQTLKFLAPVYIGESVSARVTVTKVREDKRIVTLETYATVERDGAEVAVLEGEAVVKMLTPLPEEETAA
jgi:acyl dehydratase